MDRGRCGYDLVGNKFLREKALSHKRSVHLERLEKIKNRQPGTSSTLDNNVPSSLLNNKFAKNPRKFKKKTERNLTIQRENKVLLQRISNILTAPPSITDQDYQNMKKLMHSVDYVEEWNKKLQVKRNKVFFERVKKTGAYYNPKEWESDYQKQLEGQRFMRQVNYKRPKDWVDPFIQTDPSPLSASLSEKRLVRPSTVCSSSPSRHSTASNRGSTRGGSNHVSRMKVLKQSHSTDSNHYGEEDVEVDNSFLDYQDELADIEEEDEFDDGSAEVDKVLATCERKIVVNVLDDPVVTPSRPMMRRDSSIRTMIVPPTQPLTPQQQSIDSTPNTPPVNPESRRTIGSSASKRNIFPDGLQSHQSFRSLHHANSGQVVLTTPIMNVIQFKNPNQIRYEINVQIVCILTEDQLLHLEVTGIDDTSVFAELQFQAHDLTGKGPKPPTPTHDENSASRDTPTSNSNSANHDHIPFNWTMPLNRELQNNLGQGIVEGIQLCVRGGQEYLIALPDPGTLQFEVDPDLEIDGSDAKYTDEDANKILQEYEHISVSTSSMIPIEVHYPLVTTPVRQIGLTRQKTGWNEVKTQFLWKSETIAMLLKVKRISEEKAVINGIVVRDSCNRFINPMTRKSTPAIGRDSILDIVISLPSILAIENELISEYFRNAVNHIRIRHNGLTGENKLIFEE